MSTPQAHGIGSIVVVNTSILIEIYMLTTKYQIVIEKSSKIINDFTLVFV